MIRADYQRFLHTLNAEDVPEGVRKVANLVAAHIDVLIPLGTHKGQRIRYLVPIAQTNWEAISPEIQTLPEQTDQQTPPITQLKNLAVGPFRGFARQEVFDLSNRLVLILVCFPFSVMISNAHILKTNARNLQFILAWNIHNIFYGELTDKIWNFEVIPRALIRFGNLNNDGHNSLITSSYFKK